MQDGVYYAGLADAANQIALDVFVIFFFLPQNVRTIFLEGSAKIWLVLNCTSSQVFWPRARVLKCEMQCFLSCAKSSK